MKRLDYSNKISRPFMQKESAKEYTQFVQHEGVYVHPNGVAFLVVDEWRFFPNKNNYSLIRFVKEGRIHSISFDHAYSLRHLAKIAKSALEAES